MKINKAFALAVVLIVLGGCSGSAPKSSGIAAPQAAPTPEAPAAEMQMNDAQYYFASNEEALDQEAAELPAEQQKIILDASLAMATDRFDSVSESIRETAAFNSGYVEQSNQNVRYDGTRFLNIVLRVPSDRYDFVLTSLKSLCTLTEANENQTNATAEYYDLQARLETKQIEEERLLDLISQAKNVEEILKLEEMLGQVRTQIEVYETRMRSIDRLAAYSTITVNLSEVADETVVAVPVNLSGRMYESFIKSVNSTISFFQGALILLVSLSAPIFVIAVAVIIIWGLFKIRRAMKKE